MKKVKEGAPSGVCTAGFHDMCVAEWVDLMRQVRVPCGCACHKGAKDGDA